MILLKLTFNDLLWAQIGLSASLISAIIVFILNHEPAEFLMQVFLLALFAAFSLFVGSHQISYELTYQAFLDSYREEESGARRSSGRTKLMNTMFLIALFIWKTAIVILFFTRNLKYLGAASATEVAIDLFLFYRFWRHQTKVCSTVLLKDTHSSEVSALLQKT